MRRVLSLVVLLAALVAAFAVPSTAGAAVPCRNRIYNEWYKSGKVATSFPLACYRDALRHVPLDAQVYSSLTDDIHAALLAAVRREHGQKVPALIGKGFHAKKGVLVANPLKNPPNGPNGTSTNASSPTSSSSSGGTPLPILVLGGVAIALAAAGAIGAGVRYARNRRGTA